MQLCRAFLLLCLPGCLAPGIRGDFRGSVGGTLVITCRYGVGEEGHRKFWCRGADRKDCVRVIETAQLSTEEEARRGRVTLKDIPREHRFVVVVGNLEKGDAGTYWWGVDRPGSVSQSAVRVAVFPGSMTTATRTLETSAGSSTLTSHESSPGCPIWLLLLFTSLLFLLSMKVVLLLSVGYAATRLVCFQPYPERL